MEKHKLREFIDRLFPYTEQDFRNLLMDKSNLLKVAKGSVILNPGDNCEVCPIVVEGYLRVYMLLDNAREIPLYGIGQGESCMFVTISLLKRIPYPAFAEAEEDSLLMVVDTRTFRELFDKYSYWREFFLNMIAKNIYQTFLMMNEVLSKRVDRRLISYIFEKAKYSPVLKETHEEIARKIGTAREVVSRLLKRLEVEGVIEIKRGEIFIKNRELLKKEVAL